MQPRRAIPVVDKAGADAAMLLLAGLDPGSEAGRERVRLAVEMFGLAFFETDLAAGKVTVTPNAFGLFGLPVPPVLTVDRAPFWDRYHPEDAAWARERFAADLRGERGRDDYCERVRVIRHDDGRIRWIEFSGHMFGRPGARTHIVGMLRDVTDMVEAEERQRLLLREVAHRSNNTLAVVQSLIRLTQGATVEEYRKGLQARLLSLGRTHALLPGVAHGLTDPAAVVRGELAAYADHLEAAIGPVPPLAPHSVQPVAMILHELATNAAKHGAFAHPDGQVRLAMGMETGDVVLRWTERGGPVVAMPTRRGTGMAVIGAQARQLGGTLEFQWAIDGLVLELRVPPERWAGLAGASAPA
ncbi:HWE histidine kinase domain-containing protein [Paracraurococcus ruber]|uniref:HWE histidine kinase domain-containing protein n=1 Tax=Paracraurococcus ruber TaxID=77675 RepID=UPI0019619442|nr:HWE histidine kinase domain-containing protein [Paracraurococcus ruber]